VTDLNGGVYFLGSALGPGCFPTNFTYLSYFGKTSGDTGSEKYGVKLGNAFADGQWSGSTTVRLRAGWFESDFGLASVTMSTSQLLANGTYVDDNNRRDFVIDPIPQEPFSCAALVATATVDIGADGKVTITVRK
jgi:hypothetical protein